MEHYRGLGIADRIRRLGLPMDHRTDITYTTRYGGGHELARLALPSEHERARTTASAGRDDQTPEPVLRANQMYVERFLFDHAGTRPNVRLRFGWRVSGFTQDDNGVTIRAERRGEDARWRVRYLIGCDGGHSLVRQAIGVHYQGTRSMEPGILGPGATAAHLRLPSLFRDLPPGSRAWSHWALNPELACNLITLDGVDEYFLLTSSVDPVADGAGVLVDLVRRAAGGRVPVEVLSHRQWTPGSALVAERLGDRRVLLAGDAAHLFTPTGGFGMNTGVDDVANLSWKLAATLAGWGGPHLLSSYEAERRPVAIRNTAAARTLNQGLSAIGRPAGMEDDTAAGARARATVGAELARYGESTHALGVQLGARYDGSPVIAGAEQPPPDSVHDYTPSSVPGGRVPHLWLDDWHGPRSSVFDRLGRDFTLLRLGPTAPDGAGLLAAARSAGIPVSTLDLPDSDARDHYGRDLVLVRPDQYVAWRGDTAPATPGELLAHVTGH